MDAVRQRVEGCDSVALVEQVVCKHRQHLKDFTAAIMQRGGEGVMLRQAEAVHQVGQTASTVRPRVGASFNEQVPRAKYSLTNANLTHPTTTTVSLAEPSHC